jgi:hypothetical protein
MGVRNGLYDATDVGNAPLHVYEYDLAKPHGTHDLRLNNRVGIFEAPTIIRSELHNREGSVDEAFAERPQVLFLKNALGAFNLATLFAIIHRLTEWRSPAPRLQRNSKVINSFARFVL